MTQEEVQYTPKTERVYELLLTGILKMLINWTGIGFRVERKNWIGPNFDSVLTQAAGSGFKSLCHWFPQT